MTARTSKSVIISAWAVPVLVIGQFAMLAIVPVALVLVSAAAVGVIVAFYALRRRLPAVVKA